MDFYERKKRQLEKNDKSNIGEIDKPILKLVNLINSKQEFYTTSSCAGRITLLKDMEKKQEGLFLFRTHDKINFSELKKELIKARSYKKLIYFKQEPAIIHIACKNLENAQKLIDNAKFVGFKKSGIIASSNRIVIELLSTENIILPIIDRGKILVSDEFLKLLISEANKKLERTRKKINKLYSLVKR